MCDPDDTPFEPFGTIKSELTITKLTLEPVDGWGFYGYPDKLHIHADVRAEFPSTDGSGAVEIAEIRGARFDVRNASASAPSWTHRHLRTDDGTSISHRLNERGDRGSAVLGNTQDLMFPNGSGIVRIFVPTANPS